MQLLARGIVVALVAVLVATFVLFYRRKRQRSVYFIGPHSTGKTTAILRLCELDNSTVTTLKNHHVRIRSTDISELVPNDTRSDFIEKFSINPDDKFIFFVKCEEEMRYFPDLSGYDVTFVMWIKTEHKLNGDLIYLDEDPQMLLELILGGH